MTECGLQRQRQRVCVGVCPHVSRTCLAQQLQQGGPATLSDLQRVLDDAEEAVQETKAHLRQRALSVKCHAQFVRRGICCKISAFLNVFPSFVSSKLLNLQNH